MATTDVPIPERLFLQLREAAEREEISVEEFVCDALQQRIHGKSFGTLLGIAKRRSEKAGVTAENVESIVEAEVAAHRSERRR